MFSSNAQRAKTAEVSRGLVGSVAAHGALLVLLLAGLRHASTLVRYKLPGTTQGTRLISYYAPGSPQRVTSALAVKSVDPPKERPTPVRLPLPAAPQQAQIAAPPAERGTGNAELSGLGDGDIRIAFQKYFPYPRPDLSVLAPGTKGDVILNAVIDEQGKIADLTLVRGLGPAIDNSVIATVKQWTYTPAMKNGTPVRSEQELHFHYEKS